MRALMFGAMLATVVVAFEAGLVVGGNYLGSSAVRPASPSIMAPSATAPATPPVSPTPINAATVTPTHQEAATPSPIKVLTATATASATATPRPIASIATATSAPTNTVVPIPTARPALTATPAVSTATPVRTTLATVVVKPSATPTIQPRPPATEPAGPYSVSSFNLPPLQSYRFSLSITAGTVLDFSFSDATSGDIGFWSEDPAGRVIENAGVAGGLRSLTLTATSSGPYTLVFINVDARASRTIELRWKESAVSSD